MRPAPGQSRGGRTTGDEHVRRMLARVRCAWEHIDMGPRLRLALAAGVVACAAGAGWAAERDAFLAGKGRSCAACDLAGLDLRGRDFKRAKLEAANLKGATLAGVSLFRATLVRADLSGAKLDGANLNLADAKWAD